MELLLYQSKVVEKLINRIHEDYHYILMTGKSGSGKTFTLKQLETELSREQYQVILFEGDYEYDDREYYPFKKALFLREDSTKKIIIGGVAEASKEIPVAGNIINLLLKKQQHIICF